jgi:DeoR/GlpR family transcriptional regulator of sugar metabolism
MVIAETNRLAAERQAAVRRIVGERGVVRVDELCAGLGVSAATVRRDLAVLERRGWVRRVHGGAVSLDSRLTEPVFEDKTAIAAAEKQRIAEAALTRIKPNDSVFLDGGSTVLALARLLADRNGITVVTNSLRVAGTLSGGGPRLIVVGGELRRLSQTFVGAMTKAVLEQLHVDTAFMGTIGLCPTRGLTTTDPREAFTKELVIRRAHQVVLLADGTKLDKVSFVKFASCSDVDVVITDSGAPRRALGGVRKQGCEVVAA